MLTRVDPLAPFVRWRNAAFAAHWEAGSARDAVFRALECRSAAALHALRREATCDPAHREEHRYQHARLRALARAELQRARALRQSPVRTPYLLMACSGTKLATPGGLSALQRYDGPSYRVLKAALRGVLGGRLPMRILSAEFGLLHPATEIPDYDRKLDAARADAFLRDARIGREIAHDIARVRPTEIFVMGGALYQRVLRAALAGAYLPAHVVVQYSHGGIGEQLGQLKRWLHGEAVAAAQEAVPAAQRPAGPVSVRTTATDVSGESRSRSSARLRARVRRIQGLLATA